MIDLSFFIELYAEHTDTLLKGLGMTLLLVFMCGMTGFLLSLPLALARYSRRKYRSVPAQLYIFFFRGTPLLVQLFLVYYGLAQFESLRQSFVWQAVLRNSFWCCYIVLSLNTAAYMAALLYGGIRSIPIGELQASRALGMGRWQRFYRITMPRGFRIALPSYSNEVILLLKGSALASTITVSELTYVTRTLIGETYKSIELYLVAGVIYVLISALITKAFRVLEKKLSPWTTYAHGQKIQKNHRKIVRGVGC